MCNAGHPLPLLRPSAELPCPLGQPGSLLGVLAAPTLTDVSARLVPGDCLLLYTDGVTEARSGGSFYGEDRLASALEHRRGFIASHLASDLVTEVVDFQAGLPRDDIAVIAVQVPADHS